MTSISNSKKRKKLIEEVFLPTVLIILFWLVFSFPTFSQSFSKLAWSDEFNTEGLLDTTKWTFNVNGNGWGNNELQFYREGINNAEVKNGELVIAAKKESFGGSNYTSARITTNTKKHFWRFGKIEARIKLPYGQGIWPAFWMLGNNYDTVSWPMCGEIDIMEMIGGSGRENTVHGTIHYSDADKKWKSKTATFKLEKGIFSDDYHVFAIEWTPEKIEWFVDGKSYHLVQLDTPGLEVFHNNFYLILNLAVGGRWPGIPDETTIFPQYMFIDYVRVYSL
jgi:beta-glucanase (GH16 family)